MKNQKGFTLIELLVVIGILAILLAIVLIAINPGRQFAAANETKRRSDVTAILNAVSQFAAENAGALPAGAPAAGAAASAIANTGADICGDLVPAYIAELPVDPTINGGTPVSNCAVAYTTGYTIAVSAADNRVTIASATDATITVTR